MKFSLIKVAKAISFETLIKTIWKHEVFVRLVLIFQDLSPSITCLQIGVSFVSLCVGVGKCVRVH